MEKKLNIETWARKAQYEFFKNMDYPHFNVCANLDMTVLHKHIKSNKQPFFNAMLYLATKVANEIPEFKYRIRGHEIIEHDIVHPSFTIMAQPEVFGFCTTKYDENFGVFSHIVNEKKNELSGTVDIKNEPEKDNRIYITSMPWVSFTSVSHPIHIKNVDSVPRITWGKYFKENDRVLIPFSVQVNHVLMDGVHVGKYFERLQEALDHSAELLGDMKGAQV